MRDKNISSTYYYDILATFDLLQYHQLDIYVI
jgi:hypothetical protein